MERGGITYEADPKHRELILEFFGFCEKSKVSKYNGDKEDREEEYGDEALGKEEASRYRSIAARIDFIAQGRHERLFSAKELCRHMAAPTEGGMRKIKKGGAVPQRPPA